MSNKPKSAPEHDRDSSLSDEELDLVNGGTTSDTSGVKGPRDVSTGQSSGKRQHQDFTIRKEI